MANDLDECIQNWRKRAWWETPRPSAQRVYRNWLNLQRNRYRAKEELEGLLAGSEELASTYRRALGAREDELQELLRFIVEALARQRHRPRRRFDRELHFRDASGLVAYLLNRRTETTSGALQFDFVAQYIKAHPRPEIAMSTAVRYDPDSGEPVTLEERLARMPSDAKLEVPFDEFPEEY